MLALHIFYEWRILLELSERVNVDAIKVKFKATLLNVRAYPYHAYLKMFFCPLSNMHNYELPLDLHIHFILLTSIAKWTLRTRVHTISIPNLKFIPVHEIKLSQNTKTVKMDCKNDQDLVLSIACTMISIFLLTQSGFGFLNLVMVLVGIYFISKLWRPEKVWNDIEREDI